MSLPTLLLKPLFHRNITAIGLYFPPDDQLNGIARRLKGVKWSRQQNCWYVPLSEKLYYDIWHAFKGVAVVDLRLVKEYLLQKSVLTTTPNGETGKPGI